MKRIAFFVALMLSVSFISHVSAKDFVNISVEKRGNFIVIKPLDNSKELLAIRKDKILVVKTQKNQQGGNYCIRIVIETHNSNTQNAYYIGSMPYEVAVNAMMHVLELSRINE